MLCAIGWQRSFIFYVLNPGSRSDGRSDATYQCLRSEEQCLKGGVHCLDALPTHLPNDNRLVRSWYSWRIFIIMSNLSFIESKTFWCPDKM